MSQLRLPMPGRNVYLDQRVNPIAVPNVTRVRKPAHEHLIRMKSDSVPITTSCIGQVSDLGLCTIDSCRIDTGWAGRRDRKTAVGAGVLDQGHKLGSWIWKTHVRLSTS